MPYELKRAIEEVFAAYQVDTTVYADSRLGAAIIDLRQVYETVKEKL